MENGERPVPGGRDDWRVKLSTVVGMLVGASVALFVIKTTGRKPRDLAGDARILGRDGQPVASSVKLWAGCYSVGPPG